MASSEEKLSFFKWKINFCFFSIGITVSRIFFMKTSSFPYLKGRAKPLTVTSFTLLAVCFLELTPKPMQIHHNI